MNASDIVGYAFEGDRYCVQCMSDLPIGYCTCHSKDENGICDSNCSGYGPNPIFAGDEFADVNCGSCGEPLL